MKWFYLTWMFFASSYSQNQTESSTLSEVILDCHERILNITLRGELPPMDRRIECRKMPCSETNTTTVRSGETCPDYCTIADDDMCYFKEIPVTSFTTQSLHQDIIQQLAALAQAARNETNSSNMENGTLQRLLSISSENGETSDLPDGFSGGFFGGFPIGSPGTLPVGIPNAIPRGLSGFPPELQAYLSNLINTFYFLNKFPNNCQINYSDIAHLETLLEPPVNIPYCFRAPCRSDDPTLEFDRIRCYSHPGCYFDQELFYLREYLSNRFLPGTPSCYVAITNPVFRRLANQYTDASGGHLWNPLYTQCLIDQNRDMIHAPDPGCSTLSVFNYFDIHPKVAGWKGISREDCSLIGGCYISSSNINKPQCFYPATPDQVSIKPGVDPFIDFEATAADIYGQPMCFPFDASTPQSYLDSYHQCKRSGCVIDRSINSAALQKQFLEFTLSNVSSHLRPQFWALVQQGRISPGNYRSILTGIETRFLKIQFKTFPNDNNSGLLSTDIFENIIAHKSFIDNITDANPVLHNLLLDQIGGLNFNSVGLQSGSIGNSDVSSLSNLQPVDIRSANFPNKLSRTFSQIHSMFLDILYPGTQSIPFCPFHYIPIDNFPSLKGSFEGCCERNLCYNPRSQIQFTRSGVAAYFTEYSAWSKCSVTCGKGIRTRRRRCEKPPYNDDIDCEGSTKQSHFCNQQPCPHYSSWSTFSKCSATCGRGEKLRTRVCLYADQNNTGCIGPSIHRAPCISRLCPKYSEWSKYSECGCGKGIQNRTRTCLRNCEFASFSEVEEEPCEMFCGQERLVSKGPCEIIVPSHRSHDVCTQLHHYMCEYSNPNEAHCPDFTQTRRMQCYDNGCQYCRFSNNCYNLLISMCPNNFPIERCLMILAVS